MFPWTGWVSRNLAAYWRGDRHRSLGGYATIVTGGVHKEGASDYRGIAGVVMLQAS